jgi:poly(beta-D-mannuronate) lyase
MRSFTTPILTLLLLCHATAIQATTYNITTAANFSSLPATLAAGDEISIQDGTYANVGRTLTAAGTALNPVRMYAVNPGSVFFTGETQFVLKGTNMVVSGLTFTNGCPKYASGVFRFEANSSDFILRDCKFYEFDSCSPASGAYWIQINGYHHTVEYCSFIGKSAEDQLITCLPTEDSSGTASKDIPRRHLIRYCYFADRTNISTNGFETIQIGESQYQMYDMSTTVEYCLFKRAIYGDDVSIYEPEVITSKSKNNIYRYNTFVENKGGLVLRHGDDCLVDGNFFFGESNSTMGAGVRIVGLRHIVRNNYFENIDGTDLRAAICLMKGSGEFPPDSTSNGYESPGTARIFHNTIVNCNQPFALGATTSSSGTTPPNNVEIRNNVVQSEAGDGDVINFNSANGWTISQISFSGNQAYHPSGTYGTVPASGFATGTPVNLALDVPLGYQIPQAGSPVTNSAAATTPATVYDIRSMLRAGPPHDTGDYDTEGSGTSFNHPLVKSDVGPVFDGRTNPNRVPTLLSQPVSQSVYEGDPVSFSVTATNETDPILSYQWRLNEVAIVGATGSTFMLSSAVPADAGSYSVTVTNAGGRTISYPAVLTVAPAAPVITAQPAPKLVSVGGSATFTVAADGIAPFSYQWRKDTDPITWGTNSSLTVTNVQAADVGNYSVVVSNAYGTATSQDAALSIVGGNILLSDDFSDGTFTNQSLPGSAKWYTSGGSLAISSGTLGVTAGRMALAFFKNSGVQSPAVGEQLTASFTLNFSVVGTSSGGFRFGFFNSNGAARPPDVSDSAFTDYDGYIVTTTAVYPDSNSNTNGPITIRQRNPGVGGKLLGTTGSGYYSDVAASPSTSQGFVAGTSYTVTLTIARTAAGTVNLSVGVTGGSLSNYAFTANDVSGIVTGFDGFAVLSTQSNGSTYSIDNVTVVHDTIPVPSAIFSASPTIGSAPLTVNFTDNSTGTMTSVAWDFGDGGTTNFTVPTNVGYLYTTPGVYTVTLINSNPSGAATNTQLNLITATAVDPYTSWASNYFGCTICPEAQADADPLGKGISNTNQFLLGLNPTDPASVFRVLSTVEQTTDVVITWAAGGGRTNAVQASSGDVNGSYSTNFVDITAPPHIVIPGSGDVITNYTDVGGATNVPSRFYRIRLVP